MTTPNNAILSKADLALSNLASDGGKIPVESARTFIRKLIKSPTLLRQARVVEMPSETYKIPKIQFASRILRKAVEATALTQTQRAKPTTSQISLTAQEVIATVYINYNVMEEAVERASLGLSASQTGPNDGSTPSGGIRDTIVELMAERAALDIEELGLLADTAYTNGGDADDEAFLSMFNGYLKQGVSEGNTVTVGAPISKTMFKKGLQALPEQYHRNKSALRHFVSVDQEIEYRDSLSVRETVLGDSQITQMAPVLGFGVPVESVHLMPETKGLLTHPQNLILGIRRDMSLEFAKDIEARVYKIVLTMKLDVEVEETDALVYYGSITAPA